MYSVSVRLLTERQLNATRATCHACSTHDTRQGRGAAIGCVGSVRPPRGHSMSEAEPQVSILLPVFNAMPWLPLCVLSCLQQEDVSVELLACDDGCTDGSAEFLHEVAALLDEARDVASIAAGDKRVRATAAVDVQALAAARRRLNPALQLPSRSLTSTNAAALYIDGSAAGDATAVATGAAAAAAATQSTASAKSPTAADEGERATAESLPTMSAAEVVTRCKHCRNRLVVLQSGGRGQGAALNVAYEASVAPLIGEMEADDETPPDRFKRLISALGAHPEWDGVCSQTALIGHERPGMARYVEWQNALLSPEAMRDGRFIELPALRQTGLFRRDALEKLRLPAVVDGQPAPEVSAGVAAIATAGAAHLEVYRDLVAWPVDSDFWFRWFELGLVCGKIGAPALYLWRQHAGQHTRTQGRCSLDNLRRCKVHFLTRRGGATHGVRRIEVWSTGRTLEGWVDDLRAALASDAGAEAATEVRSVEWKPGAPIPPHWRTAVAAALRAPSAGGVCEPCVVRLFAFGMPRAREKARASVGAGWRDALDWFVA